MTYTSYTLSREDLERQSAATMLVLLDFLVEKECITYDDAKRIADNYTPLIVVKESLLEKMVKLVFPNVKPDEARLQTQIIKVTPCPPLTKP